jgi:hypothetical protein
MIRGKEEGAASPGSAGPRTGLWSRPRRTHCPACNRVVGLNLDGVMRRHRISLRSREQCRLPEPPAPKPQAPAPKAVVLHPLGNPTKPLHACCGWPEHLPWCFQGTTMPGPP